MEVRFNKPAVTGREIEYIGEAIAAGRLAGGNAFTNRCERWLQEHLGAERVLLTPSCTHALEMAALLSGVGPGDEVIMPSYTFVSTANAFALRGARIVFVDVKPTDMNIDPDAISRAITDRTRVIVPVHYGGVVCDMERIVNIARENDILVVEDAAQALGSSAFGKPAGMFGHLSAFSFHETKNYTAGGEGGALAVNDPSLIERAEIIREKGTDRSRFFRGEVDKYSWVGVGSSYLPSEIQAAYLMAQLDAFQEIRDSRMRVWSSYSEAFGALDRQGEIECMKVTPDIKHNAHMFYLKCRDLEHRSDCLERLSAEGIRAVFHYVPLHTSRFGTAHAEFRGDDRVTTRDSQRLFRLPLWYDMPDGALCHVVDTVRKVVEQTARRATGIRSRGEGSSL